MIAANNTSPKNRAGLMANSVESVELDVSESKQEPSGADPSVRLSDLSESSHLILRAVRRVPLLLSSVPKWAAFASRTAQEQCHTRRFERDHALVIVTGSRRTVYRGDVVSPPQALSIR